MMLISYGCSGWTTYDHIVSNYSLQSCQTKSQSTLSDWWPSERHPKELKLYKDARHLNTDHAWSKYHKMQNRVTSALRTSSLPRGPGFLLTITTMYLHQHHLKKLILSRVFLFLFYSQLSTQYPWFSIQAWQVLPVPTRKCINTSPLTKPTQPPGLMAFQAMCSVPLPEPLPCNYLHLQ